MGGNEAQAFQDISQKNSPQYRRSFWKRSQRENLAPRKAAVELASERVRHAMTFRACG